MSSDSAEGGKPRSRWSTARTVVFALALTLTLQALVIKPYRIPSESMLDTLKVGERVLVNRASSNLGADPQVGDVLVFHPPAGYDRQRCGDRSQGSGTPQLCAKTASRTPASDAFIKRVVAVAGDTVALRGGRVIRNGKAAAEPYVRGCEPLADCDYPEPVRVPAGHVYVLGDNRGNSNDGRYWGPVPRDWVIGTAMATYWPLSEIGTL